MAIKLRSTKDYSSTGIKVLVYGRAGVGKTTLCATAPAPLIISAESGLLSIADRDVPYIEIHSVDDLYEAYGFATSEQAEAFQTICLDSISEIGEQILAQAKEDNKDGRKAYMDTQDKVTGLLRSFRDIPHKNVVFVAKQEKMQDDTGAIHFGPSMPSSKLSQNIGYFFDEVFCLNIGQDEEGSYRYLQTQPDTLYEAKDRSGKLDTIEKPDLVNVFNKIRGGQQ